MSWKSDVEPPYLTEDKLVKFLYEYIDCEGIHNKNFLAHKFRPALNLKKYIS